MFKIGEEVMDKAGNQYTILGFKDSFYDVRNEGDGTYRQIEEIDLARYSPLLAPILTKITEEVSHIETMIQGIKATQADIFERARRNET